MLESAVDGPADAVAAPAVAAATESSAAVDESQSLSAASMSSFCVGKKRQGLFCFGKTRVTCCKRGLIWTSCGQLTCASGCRGGACIVAKSSAVMLESAVDGPADAVAAPAVAAATESSAAVDESQSLSAASMSSFCVGKKRQGLFCFGKTRVTCCKRGLIWTSCGQLTCASRCRGGVCIVR